MLPSEAYKWWSNIRIDARLPMWDIMLAYLKSMPNETTINGVKFNIPTLPNGDIPFHFKLELAYHLFSKSIK